MAETLISIIISLFLGFLAGIMSIALPGFHSNTIASVISNLGIAPLLAAVGIIAVLASRSVFEILLAIFFGIPDESTGFSPLPGQSLFLEGRGHEALIICSFSAGLSTLVSAALSPLAMILYPFLIPLARPNLAFFICAIMIAYAFFQFKSWKLLLASAVVFAVSGFCGYIFLSSGALKDPLFAMFLGMFAPAWLVFSTTNGKKSKAHIVQQATYPDIGIVKYILLGVAIAFISLVFPAVSSPIFLAGLAAPLLVGIPLEAFLALIYSISFSLIVFSFALAASIGKSRVGSIEIASNLVNYDSGTILMLFCAYLVAIAASLYIFIRISSRISGFVIILENEPHFKHIVAAALAMLLVFVNGPVGLAVAGICFIVGCLPFLLGTSRVWLMGCLILPTLYYLIS